MNKIIHYTGIIFYFQNIVVCNELFSDSFEIIIVLKMVKIVLLISNITSNVSLMLMILSDSTQEKQMKL